MKPSRQHKKVFIALLALLVVVGGYILLRTQLLKLPAEFLTYRQNAADVSQQIVFLTNDTSDKIRAINISDLNGEVDSALSLIREARNKNVEAYARTFVLSKNLENLARSLDNIPSRRNQQLAYEAVAIELSLVSEFIVYTRDLNNFLDNLGRAIVTGAAEDREIAKQSLIEVNNQVKKINDLNAEFKSKISDFNGLF